jgi:hopanoid biosynthesis associated protein HpnK
MKRLIVTADDFGLSPDINRAAIRAHREGILTGTSLLVNEPHAAEAVALAKETPTLAVGLHLALSLSLPALPPGEIPDLVDGQGRLFRSATRAGLRFYFSKKVRAQVEREVRAQIEKFLASGLAMDHLNGHQHLHMHPSVFPILVECVKAYRIPALRLVRDPLGPNLRHRKGRLVYKLSHAFFFRRLWRSCRKALGATPCATADWVFGLLEDGRMTRDHVLALVRDLPEGTSEIYSHPSLTPGPDPGRLPHLEFEALIDPEIKAAVASGGVELVTYSRVAGLK